MALRARICAFMAGLALAIAPLAVHAAEPVPVEAFGSLPMISDVQIAPDGKHIAALQEKDGAWAVVIYRLGATGQKPAALSITNGSVDWITWANGERLLIATRRQERYIDFRTPRVNIRRMISVDTNAENMVLMFGKERRMGRTTGQTSLIHSLPNDPDHVLIPSNDEYSRYNLYKVNVETGTADRVSFGTDKTRLWMTDHHGTPKAFWEFNTRTGLQSMMIQNAEGEWRFPRQDNPDAAAFTPLAWSHRDDMFYGKAQNEEGFWAIYEISASDVTDRTPVFSHPDVDVTEIDVDPQTGALKAVTYAVDEPVIHHMDEKGKAFQAFIDRTFPETSVNRVISSDETGRHHIVRTSGPAQPPVFYYLDTDKMVTKELGRAYPLLKDVPLGPVRKITYAARDGLEIPAYLTLPPDTEAKNLPTVILPHGGPAARDRMIFHYWAQFIANRGYAVLQPNFRGSDGYGESFLMAGVKEWGGKMQDDVTDGTRHLISEGIADSRRICIVGLSYGGYAALMGVVKEPDLYRCAISVNGVSDLIGFLDHKSSFPTEIHYWKSHIGDPKTDRERIIAVSPARNAKRIKASVLLIHGRNDTVVPVDQAKTMAKALRRADVPHKLIKLKAEDHNLSFGKTRIATLRATEAFLREHLGPGAR